MKAGLPIIGDDIKSQVGATIVHRTLARLFHDRGVKMSARRSSTWAATWTSTTCSSASGWSPRRSPRPTRSPHHRAHSCPTDDVHIGPSDYVPWLTDRKWAHIRLEGQAFGDVPLTPELKLEVWDSQLGRHRHRRRALCKLGVNRHRRPARRPSSYLMKSPYTQRPDHLAREATEDFISVHSRTRAAAEAARAAAVEGGRGEVGGRPDFQGEANCGIEGGGSAASPRAGVACTS